MTRETDLAWAAGLFEGEGCFAKTQVQINQVDDWPLVRFLRIVKVGRIYGPYQTQRGRQLHKSPYYRYATSSAPETRRLVILLRRRLSPRRQAAAAALLERLQKVGLPKQERTHCAQGHEYTEANTYVRPRDGARWCRECIRAASKAYRKKRRLDTDRLAV